MKTFNNLEELKPYYNEKTNTYEFDDDVYLKFDLAITANISAESIKGWNIDALDINAENIDARYIRAKNIDANDIKSSDITVRNIYANNIAAYNIKAKNINAKSITFYAVCFASDNFECESIIGIRKNSKYFCLDSEVIVKNAKKE